MCQIFFYRETFILFRRISVHQQYYNNSGTCPILSNDVTHCDIDMLKVYRKLPFDDPDGGVWKQGYPITTSDLEWKGRKLKGGLLLFSIFFAKAFQFLCN